VLQAAEIAESFCFDPSVPRDELAHVLRTHLAGDYRRSGDLPRRA
jgi:hypothetical protein